MTANQIGNRFARRFRIVMVTAGAASILGPAFLIVLNHLNGTLTDDLFKLPVEAW